MADITPEQQKLLDAFESIKEACEKAGLQIDKFGSRSMKSIKDRFDALDKTVKKAGGSYKEAINQLDALAEAIEDDVDLAKDSNKKKKALDELDKRARAAYNRTLEDAGKQMIGTVVSGFATYYINQLKTGIRGIMGDSSPFQVAADLQMQMITDVGGTIGQLGKGASDAGTALMMLPNPVSKVVGGLLMLGGELLSFGASKATELFKLRTQIVSEALEKTYNSFMQASQAGALFGGGITELRAIALQSGLTQEQFTKVLAENSSKLAESGLSITEAARKVSQVTNLFSKTIGASGRTVQQELLNLGISIDEQAALTIDIISDLKRTGYKATNSEILATTSEYARNLKIISDITGEDAKKRMAQSEAATRDYAFMAALMKQAKEQNDPGLIKRVQASFVSLTQEQQDYIKQAYVMDGAIASATAYITGMAEPAVETANAIKQGGNTIKSILTPFAKFGDEFSKGSNETLQAVGTVKLATGGLADVNKAASDALLNSTKLNMDTLNASGEAVEAAADPYDDLTDGVNNSVIALQNLRNEIQGDLTNSIKNFATEVPKILSEFRKKLVEVGILTATNEKDRKATATEQMMSKATTGKTVGGDDVGFFESWFNAIGAAAAPVVPAFSLGGIADGPLEGYNARLHGTEAVVPLPDNRNIPVSLDSSTLTAAVNQNSSILNAILEEMKDSNSKASQIVQNTY